MNDTAEHHHVVRPARRRCHCRCKSSTDDAQADRGAEQKQRRLARLRASGKTNHKLSKPAPHLAHFLASQAGHATCLALNSWRWEALPGGEGLYRCFAERYSLLSYEVEPALDLGVRVSSQQRSCTVHLAKAQLLGSDAVQQQSQRFGASATHVIQWHEDHTALESHVDMLVELELFGRGPLAMLPVGAVEGPGSALLSRIIRKALTPFLQTLERDYFAWEAEMRSQPPELVTNTPST